MKVNIVTTLIALLISALIAYAFYAYSPEEMKIMVTIGGFICVASTLVCAMGIQLEEGTSANMRITAVLGFIVLLISNIVCAASGVTTPVYVITNGIILLLFILLVYLIVRSKQ